MSSRWVLAALPVAVVVGLLALGASTVRWAGDRLTDAVAVTALASGFALVAWELVALALRRVAPTSLAGRAAAHGRLGVGVALVAWGAALPLLGRWWRESTDLSFGVTSAVVAAALGATYVWTRVMERSPDSSGRDAAVAERRPPRRHRLIAGALIAVAASFAASAWVGYAERTAEGNFNWELFGIVGTALGTSLLALATGVLAIVTNADVEASREVARLTREEQEARSRPVVLVERIDLTVESAGDCHLEICVRNAGLGVAVRGVLEISYVEGATRLVQATARASSLLSGEAKEVAARVTPSQPLSSEYRLPDWSLSGWFVDAADVRHALLDGQTTEPDERVTVADPPDSLLP